MPSDLARIVSNARIAAIDAAVQNHESLIQIIDALIATHGYSDCVKFIFATQYWDDGASASQGQKDASVLRKRLSSAMEQLGEYLSEREYSITSWTQQQRLLDHDFPLRRYSRSACVDRLDQIDKLRAMLCRQLDSLLIRAFPARFDSLREWSVSITRELLVMAREGSAQVQKEVSGKFSVCLDTYKKWEAGSKYPGSKHVPTINAYILETLGRQALLDAFRARRVTV